MPYHRAYVKFAQGGGRGGGATSPLVGRFQERGKFSFRLEEVTDSVLPRRHSTLCLILHNELATLPLLKNQLANF